MTLKAASLKTMKRGRHADGRYGLYFNVIGNSGTWVQRLTIDGKRRNFGLGPWPVVSLSEARAIAFDNVRKRHRGIDPIAERRRAAAMPTFAEALDSCIALRADGWKAGAATRRTGEAASRTRRRSPIERSMPSPATMSSASSPRCCGPARRRPRAAFVFRSARGTQIDEAALRRLLRHTGTEATVHGFRGTFKSWCMETGVSRELAELSLAHTYMGDVEVSCVRTDLLERRRPIMAQWSRFVTATEAPKVVRIRGAV